MIPEFDEAGNLPPGVHQATWGEFEDRFSLTTRRQELLAGLKLALYSLKGAGCEAVYIDGSFVTAKETPGDFDACWETKGVQKLSLDPVLLDFNNGRAAQKAKYLGELFPNTLERDSGKIFSEFFQCDKSTGNPKGIILLDLRRLP